MAANRAPWVKSTDASVVLPIFVLLLTLVGRGAGAESTVTHSKLGESLDGHSTTRTTVRRVFRHDGVWYVFCGDVRNKVYHNFFVTSTDGIHWSDRKVGSGGGDIAWTNGYRVAPGRTDETTQDFYFYYPDIMIEPDGLLSISLRHYHRSEATQTLTPALAISTRPNDISSWQAPRDLIDFEPPEKSDAHENIPLPDGTRVVIVRSFSGATDEELFKPGWPGSFYACHYDGANWLKPVYLGKSDGINGSDKRLSGVLDPGTGIVHLAYIEDSGTHWKNELRYRSLSPPYEADDWSAPITIASNVFTVTLGMDTSSVPARIAAVYGDQLHEGGEAEPVWGSRWHTGRLYLKWFDGKGWQSGRQLLSEPNDEYAWFPSIQREVSGTFGVLYMKGGFEDFRNTPKELRFALVRPDAE